MIPLSSSTYQENQPTLTVITRPTLLQPTHADAQSDHCRSCRDWETDEDGPGKAATMWWRNGDLTRTTIRLDNNMIPCHNARRSSVSPFPSKPFDAKGITPQTTTSRHTLQMRLLTHNTKATQAIWIALCTILQADLSPFQAVISQLKLVGLT